MELEASDKVQRVSKEHNLELQRMAERHSVEIQHLTNTINLTKLTNSLVPKSHSIQQDSPYRDSPPPKPVQAARADELERVRKPGLTDEWEENGVHNLRQDNSDREVNICFTLPEKCFDLIYSICVGVCFAVPNRCNGNATQKAREQASTVQPQIVATNFDSLV